MNKSEVQNFSSIPSAMHPKWIETGKLCAGASTQSTPTKTEGEEPIVGNSIVT